MDINIKDINEDVVAKLDELAAKDRRSRNQFIIVILESIVKKASKT